MILFSRTSVNTLNSGHPYVEELVPGDQLYSYDRQAKRATLATVISNKRKRSKERGARLTFLYPKRVTTGEGVDYVLEPHTLALPFATPFLVTGSYFGLQGYIKLSLDHNLDSSKEIHAGSSKRLATMDHIYGYMKNHVCGTQSRRTQAAQNEFMDGIGWITAVETTVPAVVHELKLSNDCAFVGPLFVGTEIGDGHVWNE